MHHEGLVLFWQNVARAREGGQECIMKYGQNLP